VFFFVSYGPDYDSAGMTWVRGNPPVMTTIPAAVGAGAVVPPVAEREFVHWLDRDTGTIISTLNPYPHTVTRAVNAQAVTRPKAPPQVSYVETLITDGFGSVTGGGTFASGASNSWSWLP
jgi:hypothetical protein